jgi:hypothetical protein
MKQSANFANPATEAELADMARQQLLSPQEIADDTGLHVEVVRAADPATYGGGRRWLTTVEAARYLGFPCLNGRAPSSIYQIATKIGSRLNGRWLIHPDDLDSYVRALRGMD